MGRYRSIQSTLIEAALKGITDNQTVTAYKKDCKLFAVYCKAQGVKRPDQLQGKEKELLQGYEKELEASEYSPATIHIINLVLKVNDYEYLKTLQNHVRVACNQQNKKQEA